MKKIHLIITVIFISSYSCKAQKNKLTRTEYYNIKINNVTFQSLYDTNGDEASMKALFGSDLEFEANTTGPSLGRDFWNGSIYLNFEDDSDTGSYYVPTLINIKNSSVTITVKGISVKLGDDKSVFGSLFVFKSINSIIFVSETGTSSLAFKIDPFTNKISKIEFNAF
jgi:formylmethanofuran dehydrogenase subunit D